MDGATTNSDTGAEQTSLKNATSDLTNAVDEMLKQLSDKFTKVGQEMVEKMDDMSRRLDNLEAQLRASGSEGDAGDRTKRSGSNA